MPRSSSVKRRSNAKPSKKISGSGFDLQHIDSHYFEDAEGYLDLCKELNFDADPSIYTCLLTKWRILQPTLNASSLAPLLHFDWEKATFIEEIHFDNAYHSNPQLSDATANLASRVIRLALIKSSSIKKISMDWANLGGIGFTELAAGVGASSSITALSMKGNRHNSTGKINNAAILEGLSRNKSLLHLDMRHNMLGSELCYKVTDLYHSRKKHGGCTCHLDIYDGNHVWEELANSMTHGIGVLASLCGAIVLLSNAEVKSPRSFVSYNLYDFFVR